MKTTKKIISLFLAVLMLFVSLATVRAAEPVVNNSDSFDELVPAAYNSLFNWNYSDHYQCHFDDNLNIQLHGVFYSDTINHLSTLQPSNCFSSSMNAYGRMEYLFFYPSAGYQGGAAGDKSMLNYILVVADACNNVITAYPCA